MALRVHMADQIVDWILTVFMIEHLRKARNRHFQSPGSSPEYTTIGTLPVFRKSRFRDVAKLMGGSNGPWRMP